MIKIFRVIILLIVDIHVAYNMLSISYLSLSKIETIFEALNSYWKYVYSNSWKVWTTHTLSKRCKLVSIVICIICGYIKGAYAIIICNGFSKDQSGCSPNNLAMKIKSYFSTYVTHGFQFTRCCIVTKFHVSPFIKSKIFNLFIFEPSWKERSFSLAIYFLSSSWFEHRISSHSEATVNVDYNIT